MSFTRLPSGVPESKFGVKEQLRYLNIRVKFNLHIYFIKSNNKMILNQSTNENAGFRNSLMYQYGDMMILFCFSAGLVFFILIFGIILKIIKSKIVTRKYLVNHLSFISSKTSQKMSKTSSKIANINKNNRSNWSNTSENGDLVYFKAPRDLGNGYFEYQIENCIFVRDDVRQYQSRYDCVLIGSSDNESNLWIRFSIFCYFLSK